MDYSILDKNSETAGMRATFRHRVDGDESALVDWFVEEARMQASNRFRTTVFREPKLESGFPDLVIVTWSPSATRDWSADRARLTPADIRVLHYLAENGPATEADLSTVFVNQLSNRLERLYEAKTIRRSKASWIARPLDRIFAVRRIVAIEAKLYGSSTVLAQAQLNTWFASESYVLLPKSPRSESFHDSARALGIGVWTRDQGLVSESHQNPGRYPRSYASWLFNEWVWQSQRV